MDIKVPQPYRYRFVNFSPAHQAGENLYCTKHIYSFIAEFPSRKIRERYIFEIEEYEHNVCAVKFYRQIDKSKGNVEKYKVIANNGCVFRVLSTALTIMLHFLEKNPYSSFAFYGVAGIKECEANTKRYSVYRQLVLNYIGVETFERYEWAEKSYMLLLNKHNPEALLLKKIEKLFKEGYNLPV